MRVISCAVLAQKVSSLEQGFQQELRLHAIPVLSNQLNNTDVIVHVTQWARNEYQLDETWQITVSLSEFTEAPMIV